MASKTVKRKTALILWGATDLGPPHFSADILWRTGFKAPDPFFIVEILDEAPVFDKTYLLVSPLELERAAKEATADEVVNLFDHRSKTREPIVNFLKKQNVGKVIIPDTLPHSLALKLQKYFEVAVADPPFYPQRAIKTEWEVAEIEKAQRAVEKAVGKAMVYLRDCLISGNKIISVYPDLIERVATSEILRKIIDEELFKQGYLGVDTIVACGVQAADPHCAGSGPLYGRQPIVMDVFPLSLQTHYYADMTRTLFKGKPSDELRKMYENVLYAQEGDIRRVKAGVDGKEIYDWTLEYFTSQGYPTDFKKRPMEGFFHGVGHGVGIDIHEPPYIGSGGKYILQEGNVVTVEPGLYYQRARDHIPLGGIRIEDMILVTKDGYRNLTNFPKDLESMIIP